MTESGSVHIDWTRQSRTAGVPGGLTRRPPAGRTGVSKGLRLAGDADVSTAFDVAVEPAAEGTVVRVRGELDMTTAPRVHATLAEVLEHAPRGLRRRLAVDVSALTFIDARGLCALVGAAIRARRVGVAFALRGANPRLLRAIDVAGLSSVLPADDREPTLPVRVARHRATPTVPGAAPMWAPSSAVAGAGRSGAGRSTSCAGRGGRGRHPAV